MVEEAREWPVEWQSVHGPQDGLLARLQAAVVMAVYSIAIRLPEGPFSLGVRVLARVARRFDRRHREAARGFVHQAFPELSESEVEERVLQSYRHFLRVLVESARFCRRVPSARMLEHFEIVWTEDARRVIEAKEGCLLVTPHVGNWEVALSIVTRIGLGPLYAIAKPIKNKRLSRLAQAEREKRGIRLLPRRGAMVDAPRVIRAGGAIAMLLDQRARTRPVMAPFFGRLARCDRSAGVLMKRLHAPALVFCCSRTDDPLRFKVEFYDCIQPEELRAIDPVGIATRLNQTFERMIRDHPDQYFWLHDRFKDTPEQFPEDPDDMEPDTR